MSADVVHYVTVRGADGGLKSIRQVSAAEAVLTRLEIIRDRMAARLSAHVGAA